MTECTQTALQFPRFSRRKIDVSFNGGDITSNGGVQLLRLADERTGLIKAAARAIGDSRRTKSCTHGSRWSDSGQRVYGISQRDAAAIHVRAGSVSDAATTCLIERNPRTIMPAIVTEPNSTI